MSQDMEDHLRNLSSRNGRYWLRDLHRSETFTGENKREQTMSDPSGDPLPFVSGVKLAAGCVQHESVVVTIPDVGSSSQRPSRIANKIQRTAEVPIADKRQGVAKPALGNVDAKTSPSSESIERKDAAELKFGSAIPNEEPSSDQVNLKIDKELPDDAIMASRSGQTEAAKDSIARIADKIVSEFPVASPAVVAFIGSQVGLHTDETCARVAAELGGKDIGRVLLIDSDFNYRRLSKASGMNAQAGVSEIMNIAYKWSDAILKSGSSQLDFMPVGNCSYKRWTPTRILKEALAEMKTKYQFICVCAGDAHDPSASMWAGLSDGALLLVSETQSNNSIARSAVAQLRKDGGRIFGCVLTDVVESPA